MRPRRRKLSLVAAAVAGTALLAGPAALLVGPAEGQAPASAAIVASDNQFRTIDGGAPAVTVTAGGHVDFAYPIGNSRHNVVFTGAQPSLCGISSAAPASSNMAPLPNAPAGPGWEGGCTFDAAGSYPYVCGLHGSMTGSVAVVAVGTPPPPPPPPAAAPGPAASSPLVASAQRGTTVRGSVRVRSGGSRLLARAFARRRALYSGSASTSQVRVGRRLRSSVGPGRVAFSVALDPVARRALRRNGRLAINLRLTVTPPVGSSYTATRAIVVRPL